ncbi:ABC transporter permease [Geomicrobium sp. JCM 19039]|uniref:ABC transporter permease n=1 Tax=Geomicrobium sp. JCM 19039 TaxID=1460636 RepID=UPI00045F3664|nr:ABC transporter permease [Geomicrobium sp. JCM 19039]GAK10741.1 hydroxymethylpyrimidine ABC transporter, transmembrane component [Geomicrobium sp. JCM 19039]
MRRTWIYSLILLIVVIFGWEWFARGFSDLLLPGPMTVFVVLIDGLITGYFWPHIVVTVSEILLGLALGLTVGFAGGILMGQSEWLRRVLFPYLVASQAVPKLALAPLFMLWFGYGMTSKVIITALVCFFPILEATVSAVQHVDKNRRDLFRMMHANRWQTLVHLQLPAGLPILFQGLRVAVILAIVGAIVGEFIGANQGLGALIIASQSMMDTALMFAVLLLLTAIGLLLYGGVYIAERRWIEKRHGGERQ